VKLGSGCDKPLADLFDMQDEIVSRLGNTLNVELIEAEARRAERSPHPDAMELYFEGRACINRGVTPALTAQARGFFASAIAHDPSHVEAAIGMAETDLQMGAAFMTDDRARRFQAAETVLIEVLSRAPNHARAHMLLGIIQIHGARSGRGLAELERAVALDRNLADAYGFMGLGKYIMGRGSETEAHIQQAFRLSPRDTRAFLWMGFAGLGKLSMGADFEAVEWFRRSLEANRNHPLSHFHYAAALGLAGDLEEARAAAKAGLSIDPSFTISRYRDTAQSDHPVYFAKRERIYEGMRLAGVPEG
jgi:tetratricopeptide (TPR) repeat protein